MNPYQSPHSNPSVKLKKSPKRDRDQCPSCLHRQSIWKAVNSLGRYHCPKCSTRLTVQTPKRYIYIFMVTGFTFLGLMWWFLSESTLYAVYSGGSGVLILIANLVIRSKLGYLDRT